MPSYFHAGRFPTNINVKTALTFGVGCRRLSNLFTSNLEFKAIYLKQLVHITLEIEDNHLLWCDVISPVAPLAIIVKPGACQRRVTTLPVHKLNLLD
ncbi:hypothetical protein AGRA671_28425 [Agrobacterium radiobacter]|nr:Uncharacterised protein [Agrobacterium tumefaciens]